MARLLTLIVLLCLTVSPSAAQRAAPGVELEKAQCPKNQIFFDGTCRAEAFFDALSSPGYVFLTATGCTDRTLIDGPSACGSFVMITERNRETGWTRVVTLDRHTPDELAQEAPRRNLNAAAATLKRPQRGDYAIVRITRSRGLPLPGGEFDFELEDRWLGREGLLQTVFSQTLLYSTAPSAAPARQDYDVTGRICARRLEVEARPQELACTCLDEDRCGIGSGEQSVFFADGVGRVRYCSRSSSFDEAQDGLIISELDLLLDRAFSRGDIPELLAGRRPSSPDEALTCYRVQGMAENGLLQTYSSALPSPACSINLNADRTFANLSCNISQQSAGLAAGGLAFVFNGIWNVGTSGTSVSYAGQDISLGHVLSTSASAASSAYNTTVNGIQTVLNMANADTCNDPALMISAVSMNEQQCQNAAGSCEGTHTVAVKTELTTGAVCDTEVDVDCSAAPGAQNVSLTDAECVCDVTDVRTDYESCR